MARFIVHHDGHFFEWSTISDMPETRAMTQAQLEAYYREEHGQAGMDSDWNEQHPH
jgi:hypothetical protein